jgi:hypothetical protein
MNKVVFLLIGVSLFCSCATEPRISNFLCIIELGRKEGPEYVYLPNDYGFLIDWVDNTEAELYIYDKPAQRIKMTSDFANFLSELQQFPNGIKVDQIHGCATTAAGMSQEQKSQLNELIQKKKFILTDVDDGNYPFCSCETTYVRKYKTDVN